MTGAQKCTVLKPMGLFHMRENQDGWASPAVELCHRRPADARCDCQAALWAPNADWRKAGRAARKRDVVAGILMDGFGGGQEGRVGDVAGGSVKSVEWLQLKAER